MCTAETTARNMKTFSGIQKRTISRRDFKEIYLTVTRQEGESTRPFFERAAAAVRKSGARIVSQEVLGLPEEGGAGIEALTGVFGGIPWPVTWIENGKEDARLCSTQIWGVAGAPVHPVELQGRVVGSIFEDEHIRYCRLGGIGPNSASRSPKAQARETMENLEAALGAAGMSFSQTVRTWFFVDDILSWYGIFNQARTEFFRDRRIFEGRVPASTGIGGRNPEGSALTAGLIAMELKSQHAEAFAVPSPLQCPALEYGSSFSRAVEVSTPELRRLFVSGTASIDSGGETAHSGDVDKQIDRTFEVVSAILESRDMMWDDVVRGNVYLKDPRDLPAFLSYCVENDLSEMPFTVTKNPICREDLLFEIEVDALQKV